MGKSLRLYAKFVYYRRSTLSCVCSVFLNVDQAVIYNTVSIWICGWNVILPYPTQRCDLKPICRRGKRTEKAARVGRAWQMEMNKSRYSSNGIILLFDYFPGNVRHHEVFKFISGVSCRSADYSLCICRFNGHIQRHDPAGLHCIVD